jgi:hypothetical protein
MNSVTKQVIGVVAAVTIFAILGSVGYLVQVGFTQTFGPGNTPSAGNVPSRSRGNNADSGRYTNEPRDPIPEDESVWEDFDEVYFKNKERAELRPGNFEVLQAFSETLAAMKAVKKSYGPMAFPFWEEEETWATQQDWDADEARSDARARETGEHRRNILRLFNLEVKNVQLITLEAGKSDLAGRAEFGMSDKEFEHFKEVRKAHPERCVLVLLEMDLMSLESNVINEAKAGNPTRMVYVKKSDGWKIVCIED